MNATTPVVIGIGNPDRGDDGVGLVIAEQLAGQFEVMVSAGDPAGLLALWEGATWVILVDAVSADRCPGSVIVVELLDLAPGSVSLTSTHGMGPLEAVEIGRALGMLPPRITLVGVEASRFHAGERLSEPVAAAVGPAIATLRRLVTDATRPRPVE